MFPSTTAEKIPCGILLKFANSCFVSLGKQYPPYPKEGLLYPSPILGSNETPIITDLVSRPLSKQKESNSLKKVTLVAKYVFANNLTDSASDESI